MLSKHPPTCRETADKEARKSFKEGALPQNVVAIILYYGTAFGFKMRLSHKTVVAINLYLKFVFEIKVGLSHGNVVAIMLYCIRKE